MITAPAIGRALRWLRKNWHLAIMCAVITTGVVCLITLFALAAHNGAHTRHNTDRCHALGPQYHYWQDRERCVRYVELP